MPNARGCVCVNWRICVYVCTRDRVCVFVLPNPLVPFSPWGQRSTEQSKPASICSLPGHILCACLCVYVCVCVHPPPSYPFLSVSMSVWVCWQVCDCLDLCACMCVHPSSNSCPVVCRNPSSKTEDVGGVRTVKSCGELIRQPALVFK